MSWEVEMVEVVRVMLNDMADSPTYSDERIERAVIVGAYQLVQEVTFATTYTVSIRPASITPDPTNEPLDPAFIYLCALKTACLIMQGEFRKYSLSSLQITDGPSSISTAGRATAIKALYDGLCAKYDMAKAKFALGKGGQAITTPTTVSNLYPNQEF